jgi:chromosome segregation protein
MVFIKKLVLKGFKSFANHTELLFGNGFNCIIGPNGSGKTNISDAVCFVLGKSSAHEMRAEKSANLIFNGGKKGNPSKEAEVTIEFDNSSGKFNINTKEVSITRIVKLNGTSIYKINDEVRTRQQVLDLLNVARIDPDGHNIVLQGDIVSLAEMKPIQRREMIETISGISMYEEKKQKCLNELGKVDAKLNEAEIILTEREANLRELKKERDQAVRFKELQDNIKDYKATLIHFQLKEKQERLDEIEKRKKEAEDKIVKVNEDIKLIKQNINTNKDEISKINHEIEVKGEKEQIVLRKEIEELKTNLVKLNSRLEVCQSELIKIKSRKDQLNNNIKEIEEKIKELGEHRNKLESQIKEINEEEVSIHNKIEDFKSKNGIDNNIGNSLELLDKQLDETLEEINKINEEKQNILRNNDQVTFKLNALDEKLNNVKSAEKEVSELKDKKKLLKELNEKLSKTINEDSSYSVQLNNLKRDISLNTEEYARVRSRQIGIEEKSMGDHAIRKILELKKELKGIHGTVSSLGEVDSQYSVALEVAAGPRLFSIVVDNDTTAQKCIEHLKNNKLGVATFLPLNKIRARVIEAQVKEILNKKGVHGLAVDLIKYDSEYADVFSYALGSTVIVDDIPTGRTIGIGKARMVTLQGDLMEPSGAMIGGFRSNKTGLGFKEKQVNEEVTKLEEELANQKNMLVHIESKKTVNEEAIRKLREQRAEFEAEILKIEKTFNLDGDTNLIIYQKKDLLEESKNYENQIAVLEEKILKLQDATLEIKENKTKLKEKIADPNLSNRLSELEEQKLKIRERTLEIHGNIKNINTQIESMLNPEKIRLEKLYYSRIKSMISSQKS